MLYSSRFNVANRWILPNSFTCVDRHFIHLSFCLVAPFRGFSIVILPRRHWHIFHTVSWTLSMWISEIQLQKLTTISIVGRLLIEPCFMTKLLRISNRQVNVTVWLLLKEMKLFHCTFLSPCRKTHFSEQGLYIWPEKIIQTNIKTFQ